MIRQLLAFLGSIAFMLLWTFAWGLLATGSLRSAARYMSDWLRVIGITAFAGAVVFLIVWPFLSPG